MLAPSEKRRSVPKPTKGGGAPGPARVQLETEEGREKGQGEGEKKPLGEPEPRPHRKPEERGSTPIDVEDAQIILVSFGFEVVTCGA